MREDQVLAARLGAEENETIFRNYVVRRELPRNAEPNDHPVIILVGGQPGAGKTSLVTSGVKDLAAHGATVQIVGDNLRSYHPQYDAYQRNDPALASQLTHHDAGIWTDKLLLEAASRRLNIVFETTMRSPDAVAFIAQQARAAGYRVETRIVAVNERESWQGCLSRFEQMHAEGNAARIPPREHHDNAVVGLVDTIQHLEERKLVDAIQVRLRNGKTIFQNDLVDGEWLKPAGAAVALVEERSRAKTPEELEVYSARWQTVLQAMEKRNADRAALEAVRAMAADDLAQFKTKMERGPNAEIKRGDLASRPLIPAHHIPDLTPAEIAERAMATSSVQNGKAEIERLSKIVYGDSAALYARLELIERNPPLAGVNAYAVRFEPQEIAPFPGRPAGWIRPASPERLHAETYVPSLADAIKDYGQTLSYERKRIADNHASEQRRLGQEVPAPSPQLLAALQFPPENRLAQFQANPDIHKELTSLSVQLDKRLAPHEHKAFQTGDLALAQRSIGVPMEQIRQIAQVRQQIRETNQVVRSRAMTQSQGPVITR